MPIKTAIVISSAIPTITVDDVSSFPDAGLVAKWISGNYETRAFTKTDSTHIVVSSDFSVPATADDILYLFEDLTADVSVPVWVPDNSGTADLTPTLVARLGANPRLGTMSPRIKLATDNPSTDPNTIFIDGWSGGPFAIDRTDPLLGIVNAIHGKGEILIEYSRTYVENEDPATSGAPWASIGTGTPQSPGTEGTDGVLFDPTQDTYIRWTLRGSVGAEGSNGSADAGSPNRFIDATQDFRTIVNIKQIENLFDGAGPGLTDPDFTAVEGGAGTVVEGSGVVTIKTPMNSDVAFIYSDTLVSWEEIQSLGGLPGDFIMEFDAQALTNPSLATVMILKRTTVVPAADTFNGHLGNASHFIRNETGSSVWNVWYVDNTGGAWWWDGAVWQIGGSPTMSGTTTTLNLTFKIISSAGSWHYEVYNGSALITSTIAIAWTDTLFSGPNGDMVILLGDADTDRTTYIVNGLAIDNFRFFKKTANIIPGDYILRIENTANIGEYAVTALNNGSVDVTTGGFSTVSGNTEYELIDTKRRAGIIYPQVGTFNGKLA